MTYNILFSICSLGLGHATRSLPLIKYYLGKGNKIYISSEQHVLNFLKNEFPKEKNVVLIEKVQKYPPLERGSSIIGYGCHIVFDGLRMPHIIKLEHNFVEKLVKKHKIDFVISDGTYGGYSYKVPCFLITHQLEFQFIFPYALFGKCGSRYNLSIFKRFTKVLVPDYIKKMSLSGDLAYNPRFKNINTEYIGILSQYTKKKIKEDIDYLVIISGYLHEHKKEFYDNLITVLEKRKGKKIFIMGDHLEDYHKKLPGNIEVYSSFKGLDKNELFNRAKVIISRTGYTTLMDLLELNKKAILIPTPKQSEQVYLAKYHQNKGYFNIVMSQKDITDKNLINDPKNTILIENKNLPKTKETVKKVAQIIDKCIKK